MPTLLPEFQHAFTVDYYARGVNIVISILGLLSNLFHFSILIQKPLRSHSVFIMMLVICSSDLLLVVVLISIDIQYTSSFNSPDLCLGFYTYGIAVLHMITNSLTMFSNFVTKWVAVMMAAVRILSVKFAMSSWSETLSKPITAIILSVIAMSFALAYNLSEFYFLFNIAEKPIEIICPYTNYTVNAKLYTMAGDKANHEALRILTMFSGVSKFLQTILFVFCTICLVVFIRKNAKKKILKNRDDRKAERTEGLILFTLLSFFLSTVPMMLANFLIPLIADDNLEVFNGVVMSMTTMVIFQTLNASGQIFICLLMSTQYRDVARAKWWPRKELATVAPISQDIVHEENIAN